MQDTPLNTQETENTDAQAAVTQQIDTTPTPQAEIIAETAAETAAENVAETAPEVAAETATEVAAEAAAETTPEVVAETAAETTPEVVAPTVKRRTKPDVATAADTSADTPAADAEPDVDYTMLTLPDALDAFEKISKEAELSKVQGRIVALRKHIQDMISQEINDKKAAFIADGGDEAEFKPEANNANYRKFNDTNIVIKERRGKERELQDAERNANMAAKERILDRLKAIIDNSEAAAAFDEFKKLQEDWRKIGSVPADKNQEIWERYTFYLEKVYDDFKISKELRMLDFKKNLEQKITLCEKVEELFLKDNIGEALKELSIIHDDWKAIGPVPNEQREAIWDRFKSASDKIYDKRKEYYDTLDEERKNNHALKIELCEKAEALAITEPQSHKDWEALTEQFAAIQADWRKVGLAPREVNEQIWTRFKTIGDGFYNAKNDFYKNIREEQSQNYNLRMELCARAEALMNSDDWKIATDEFVKIQKEWKEIGAVGRKQAEKLWQRFQAACNTFFERKKVNFADKDAAQGDNLIQKIALIERIENFASTENGADDFETLKAFQREWMNIGFVPMKDKKTLEDRYRKTIDAHFDAIKLNRNEQSKSRYQTKLDTLKTVANPAGAFKREESGLGLQITKLNADIALWENNIEFFARSKNADALRKEIQNKIDKAQSEIAQLKDKMKLLKQA